MTRIGVDEKFDVKDYFAAIRRKERKRVKELFVSFAHLCGD